MAHQRKKDEAHRYKMDYRRVKHGRPPKNQHAPDAGVRFPQPKPVALYNAPVVVPAPPPGLIVVPEKTEEVIEERLDGENPAVEKKKSPDDV